uniref:Maturase K n=1 Tax=Panagrolaimus sp. PS1159 TaxID=55785 RepID=A0AC35FC37_9BILA
MDKFSDAYFDWNRIEERYGSSQGEVDPKLYNFHLQIVEIYFKFFHGKRIGAHLPLRMRQRLIRELFISFIKRCFLITFQRYFDYEKPESYLLLKFKIYRQFFPILHQFDSYFK